MNNSREMKVVKAAVDGLLKLSRAFESEKNKKFPKRFELVRRWLATVFKDVGVHRNATIGIRTIGRTAKKRGAFVQIRFDEEQIEILQEILVNLKLAIVKNSFYHFHVVREQVYVDHDYREEVYPDYNLKDHVSYGQTRYMQRKSGYIFRKSELKRKAIDAITIHTVYAPITKFGHNLLKMYDIEMSNEIPELFCESWRTLSDVVIMFLVHFHGINGSYRCIKICKQCNGLTLEYRNKRKQLCSTPCVSAYYKSMKADLLRCYKRQYAYINYAFNEVGGRPKYGNITKCRNIKMEVCYNCKVSKYPAGGKCPYVIKNNRALLKAYRDKASGF